jgi:hypothetical protein
MGIGARRAVAFVAVVSVLAVASAFAQTAAPRKYDVELAVKKKDKSVTTDVDIAFGEGRGFELYELI